MKSNNLRAALALLAGSFFSVSAQAEETAPSIEASPGIPGFLNPTTGVFTSKPALAPAPNALSATATIAVTFTVKINTTIPLGQPITCSLRISSFDSSFFNSASGQNYVTKSSATAGVCRVVIPYVWQIANAATTMSVSAGISTSNASGAGTLFRSADATIPSFPVPLAGIKNIAVTLAL